MPGETGVTVVTMLVCLFYFAREAAGASSARHSLRPLTFRGRFTAKLAHNPLARSRSRVWNGTVAAQSIIHEIQVLTFVISIAISTAPGTSGLSAFELESQMTGSTRSSGGLDQRRRRVLFRCWHRGTREMDLILGRFADAEIASLADDELAQLERLIDVPDPELYAALTGDTPPAPEYADGLFDRIKSFRAVDQAR